MARRASAVAAYTSPFGSSTISWPVWLSALQITGPALLPVPVGANEIKGLSAEYVTRSPALLSTREANPMPRDAVMLRPRINPDMTTPDMNDAFAKLRYESTARTPARGQALPARTIRGPKRP